MYKVIIKSSLIALALVSFSGCKALSWQSIEAGWSVSRTAGKAVLSPVQKSIATPIANSIEDVYGSIKDSRKKDVK